MSNEFYDKYVIVDFLPAGSKSMRSGVHMEKRNQFATWEFYDDQYLWAHYFTDQTAAVKDLCERTLREIHRLESKDHHVETDYTITAIVKNEGNMAVIEFPTDELSDILGSIGITETPDKVCIGGPCYIEITPGAGSMADALNHIFQNGDSLHLINEVAKAVYHADFRVYGMVEEKLKYGQFHAAKEVLKDARALSELIKKQEQNKKR